MNELNSEQKQGNLGIYHFFLFLATLSVALTHLSATLKWSNYWRNYYAAGVFLTVIFLWLGYNILTQRKPKDS